MILNDIINKIEMYFPLSLACEWDNSGLILGDRNREIKKCMVSLDVTEKVLEEAIENNADLIITHHPLIFSGVKKINSDTAIGRMLLKAAENKIALYAAHTNMDMAEYGINAKLSEIFNMKNTFVINEDGLGLIGDIDKMPLSELLKIIREKLDTPFLRYSGNENQLIGKIAICSGSGSEIIENAIKNGADCVITGDLKYHTSLDYTSDSFSIIDAGHFPTEKIAMDMFCEILKDVEVIKSSQKDIFNLFV